MGRQLPDWDSWEMARGCIVVPLFGFRGNERTGSNRSTFARELVDPRLCREADPEECT